MKLVECEIPYASALDREFIESAYFTNCYRVSLDRKGISVVDIFFAIFAHHPIWLKGILMVRNRIASLCGLDAADASEMLHFEKRNKYHVGDKIGVWPIFVLTDTELIAGRDNKHLDFRLELLKLTENKSESVTVSTVCKVHNVFGKIYLTVIIPFHKWGIRRLISHAILSGRL
jgi:Protein of unknown function (DUF2867)